jgi:hypothetical protein
MKSLISSSNKGKEYGRMSAAIRILKYMVRSRSVNYQFKLFTLMIENKATNAVNNLYIQT